MTRSIAFAFLCAALGVASRATAAGSERAATIFRQGQEAFAHKSYAAAAAAFEQAAELAPHPSAWLDAAEAWELDGAFARAAEDCDRALAMAAVSGEHRREAESRLARLAPKVATLELRTSRPLLVVLDGTGELRAPGRHRLAPGRHAITIDLGATSRSLTVDARAGETSALDLDPPPTPPEPTPAAASPTPPAPVIPSSPPRGAPPSPSPGAGSGPPLASWVSFGVAAAATGTALVAGAMTLSARSDFNDSPSVEARDRFYRERAITDVAWGVAAVAGAAGAVFWLATPRGDSRALAVVVRDTGVFVAHETRF